MLWEQACQCGGFLPVAAHWHFYVLSCQLPWGFSAKQAESEHSQGSHWNVNGPAPLFPKLRGTHTQMSNANGVLKYLKKKETILKLNGFGKRHTALGSYEQHTKGSVRLYCGIPLWCTATTWQVSLVPEPLYWLELVNIFGGTLFIWSGEAQRFASLWISP